MRELVAALAYVVKPLETVLSKLARPLEADAFEIGKTYVFNAPPGWIFVGTVTEKVGNFLILKDAAHLETTGANKTTIGDLPECSDSKLMEDICPRANPLADGHMVNAGLIIQAVPCVRDATPLSRRRLKEAVESLA